MVKLQQQHRQTRLANAAADSLRHLAAQQRPVPPSFRRSSSPVSASWRFSASASTRIPIEDLERILQHRVPHRDIAVQAGKTFRNLSTPVIIIRRTHVVALAIS